MSQVIEQIERFRAADAAELRAGLSRAMSAESDWLRAAEYARQVVTSDVEWSLRLADALHAAAPPESSASIRALTAKAHALCYKGMPNDALAALTHAERKAQRAGGGVELADVLLATVQPQFLLGRLAEAAAAAQAARDEFARLGLERQAAMAEVNLGGVLRRLNQPQQALEHFDRAKPVLGSEAVPRAMIDSNRAEALLDLDQYADALAAFESALQAFESVENGHAAALVEGNIADLRSRQGYPDEALRHFEAARRRFEALGSEVQAESARLRVEEAECLARLGATRESLTRFRDALATLERLGLAYEAARCRLAEGRGLIRSGELDAAASALRDAAERFGLLGDDAGLADAQAARADLELRRKQLAAALELLHEAEQRAHAIPSRRALIACDLALALLQAGRRDEAHAAAARAADIAAGVNLPPLQIRVRFVEGVLAGSDGDPARAVERLSSATELLERLHGALPADRYRYAFLCEAEPIYGALCSAALDWGGARGLHHAVHALESCRARGLLDLLGSAPASQAWVEADDPAERRLLNELTDCQAALSVVYNRIALDTTAEEDAAPARPLASRLSALETRYQQIESRILAASRFSPVVARPLPLDELQAHVAPDGAMVLYFRERDAYGAFVIRADRVAIHRQLCSCEAVAQGLRRLSFHVRQAMIRVASNLPERPAGASWDSASAGLCSALVEPLGDDLHGAQRIGICPDSDLHGLPLHALRRAGQFAFGGSTCVYLPSATIGVRLRPRWGGPAPLRALVVGIDDEIAPGMRGEAEEIAALYPGCSALLGDRATVAALAAGAAQADLIHLATHCVFSESNPSSSRIRLADRWLSAREITRLRLGGAVIVLAGCETGRSAEDTGRERFGLIRAFLAAGASAVVVSHWPLHDALARRLFLALHRRFLQSAASASPARCLLDVQAEFARRGTHPAFWSGLFVVGGIES